MKLGDERDEGRTCVVGCSGTSHQNKVLDVRATPSTIRKHHPRRPLAYSYPTIRPPNHSAMAPPFTHFVSIPLITLDSKPQFDSSMKEFRDDVCEAKESPSAGSPIPAKAIKAVGSLHLTICLLNLEPSDGVEVASAILKGPQIQELLSNSNPLAFKTGFRGLQTFESNNGVLFTPPSDPAGQLQKFCQSVKDVFLSNGLAVDTPETAGKAVLTLHATIMDLRKVKKIRSSIDQNALIERYKEFVWADNVVLERVEICTMGAQKLDNGDERYEGLASVLLPAQ